MSEPAATHAWWLRALSWLIVLAVGVAVVVGFVELGKVFDSGEQAKASGEEQIRRDVESTRREVERTVRVGDRRAGDEFDRLALERLRENTGAFDGDTDDGVVRVRVVHHAEGMTSSFGSLEYVGVRMCVEYTIDRADPFEVDVDDTDCPAGLGSSRTFQHGSHPVEVVEYDWP